METSLFYQYSKQKFRNINLYNSFSKKIYRFSVKKHTVPTAEKVCLSMYQYEQGKSKRKNKEKKWKRRTNLREILEDWKSLINERRISQMRSIYMCWLTIRWKWKVTGTSEGLEKSPTDWSFSNVKIVQTGFRLENPNGSSLACIILLTCLSFKQICIY